MNTPHNPSRSIPPSHPYTYRVLQALLLFGQEKLAIPILWIVALLTISGTLRAQNNLLANPGFETGSTSGWADSYGSYSVLATNPHAGTYGATVGYGSAVRQTVTGLSPGTTYTLSGWLKVATAGQVVYLGAQNFGGTSVSQSVNTTGYAQRTFTFTTGAAATSATIFVYQSGANAAYCDDLSLTSPAGDLTGTQALRIADCLQRFGVNTFSKFNNNGYPWAWGGSKGDYYSATVSRAINYITAGSGLTIYIREYHRDLSGGNAITPFQKTWMKEVYAATGSRFTLAIGANGSAADIPGMVDIVQDSISTGLNYVKWVEGLNEPNNDFGSGTIPIATTTSVQSSLYQQIHAITSNVPVAGPSIVFGLAYPDGWLTGYLGTGAYKQTVLNNSDFNNVHLYPPKSPNAHDGSNRGGTMADVDTAFTTILPGKPVLNTEWHPTLYSTIHNASVDTDNNPNNDGEWQLYGAYWGPIYLLSSYLDFHWDANFWFALFDNKPSMKCGLFATSDADPYPVANALRALYQLTGDQGATKLTFTPWKLDVSVTGLPAAPANAPRSGGRWALFQNSAHTYFLFLWNDQNDLSTSTAPVTVTFNSHNMTKVEEFNITSGSTTALQTLTNVHTKTVNLNTSLRLLRITY